MNIIFLHKNFPAQFRHVATHYARDPNNNVVFVSEEKRKDINIPGVKLLLIKPGTPLVGAKSHKLLQTASTLIESSSRHANALLELRANGFIPDLVYDHSGWGFSLFIRDIFPEAAYATYCEWYYTQTADWNFFSKKPRHPSKFSHLRIRNLSMLSALTECDVAIAPTKWQKSQFPALFHNKISVLHDGINTDFFQPEQSAGQGSGQNAGLSLPGLTLAPGTPIVTYTTRGFEPYRGFPVFYRSIANILKARPDCHVVLMGKDKPYYSKAPEGSTGYAARMRQEMPLDEGRVHFLDFGSYEDYLKLLQASTVHVYLTAPFVLSWSMLEAMSAGCLLVASGTEPVKEIIEDGFNGLLTDFFDHDALVEKVIKILENPAKYAHMRKNARRTIIDKYSQSKLLPRHIELLKKAVQTKSRERAVMR